MKNNQKGITLVALVITIIVLLILAGVTIAALSGQNGILTNASNSQVQNALGNAKDQINLAANEGIQAYYNMKYLNENDTIAGPATGTTKAGEVVKKYVEKRAVTGNPLEGVTVEVTGENAPYSITITTTDKTATTATGTITEDGAVNWTN
mgnify:CR=1 FL=1